MLWKGTETKNEDGVHVKNDPDDIEIKDELMELPLDVTLESDGDNHVDPKAISTDDDQSIPGEWNNEFIIYTELQYVIFALETCYF